MIPLYSLITYVTYFSIRGIMKLGASSNQILRYFHPRSLQGKKESAERRPEPRPLPPAMPAWSGGGEVPTPVE
jgi:hypothetical protein